MSRKKRELTTLGQEIKIECARRKISISAAAKLFGMSHSNYLSRMMYGEVGVGRKYESSIRSFLEGKKII